MNGWEEARLADAAAQAASAERYAREHGMIGEPPAYVPPPPTAAERIAFLGGAEHASKIASDPGVPLEPARVVSQAEYDRFRAERQMPIGVAIRYPQEHPVPAAPARPVVSKFIAECLAEGDTWA